MKDKKLENIQWIETVRVDVGNGYKEFNCISELDGNNAFLKIGDVNTIGGYKMLDNKLYIITDSAEYEIKDWYFRLTYDLKEIMITQDVGCKLNTLPIHPDDFAKVVIAFKNTHKFGKWKLKIMYEPTNNEAFKGLIREILRDRVKPQYPNYNDRYEDKLINIMFKDSIKELGEASPNRYEEYYIKYLVNLNEFIEANSEKWKPMVENKPGIGTKIMNLFK